MPSRAQGLTGLLRLSGVVAAAGGVLPTEFVELRDRFQGFSQLAASHAPTMIERLTSALITGHGDPHLWFAAAMAQAGAGHVERRAEILQAVHNQMDGVLRGLYQPLAGPIYRQLAQRFDRAAERFTRCADVVDPGAEATEVVNANTKTLTAWRDALAASAELDAQLEGLAAAAELLRPLNMPSGSATPATRSCWPWSPTPKVAIPVRCGTPGATGRRQSRRINNRGG